MGRRWTAKEEDLISQVRKSLKHDLANRPQFPEVVGDRRILRFLRGKQHNVEEATRMIKDMLQWRLDNNVDAVRQDILYGGKDSPFNFPKGKLIIGLAPQIVLSVNALDKCGQPLSLEQFNFSPKEVFKAIKMDDYLTFLTYCLEYRALVLEQVSHEREQAYLAAHREEENRKDGYGVIVMDFTIRDLKGVGMAHLGTEGRALVQAALKIGLPNYQEYMGKSHMVNVPWVFSSMWYFVKGLLDEFTLAKLTLSGTDYMDTLLKEVPFDSIPACLGGGFHQYNEHYEFDLSEGGALFYEGCPKPPAQQTDSVIQETLVDVITEDFPSVPSVSVEAADKDEVPNPVGPNPPKIIEPTDCDSSSHRLWRNILLAAQAFKSDALYAVTQRPFFSFLFALALCCCVARHDQQQLISVFLSSTVLFVVNVFVQ